MTHTHRDMAIVQVTLGTQGLTSLLKFIHRYRALMGLLVDLNLCSKTINDIIITFSESMCKHCGINMWSYIFINVQSKHCLFFIAVVIL